MSKITRQALDKYVQLLDNFSKTNLVSSESNTQIRLIQPLIELLGWDILSDEVRAQYKLTYGSKTNEVDYALCLEGKPLVLLEAKPFDDPLSESASDQILSYSRADRVRWAAISNGRVLKIFDTSIGKYEHECLIGRIDLTRPWDFVNELMLIHRDSILSGDIESTAKRLIDYRIALTKLKDNESQLSKKLEDSVISLTGEAGKIRAGQISTQLAKKVIELFENQSTIPDLGTKTSAKTGEISRKELSQKPIGDVIICPSRIDGVEFLKKYNAWGYINLNIKRRPKYLALYVGKPESSLLYFGEIEKITEPIKSVQEIEMIEQKDRGTFKEGKRVVFLKKDSLVKFSDPIPLVDMHKAPRGIKYISLEKIISANKVEDL